MYNNSISEATLRVQLLPGGRMPTKGRPEDAGFDLYSPVDVSVHPRKAGSADSIVAINLGIMTELQPGWCAIIKDRGSMGSKGIHALAGVVDSNFRGEWRLILTNLSNTYYFIQAGDKIAQFVVLPVPTVHLLQVGGLSDSDRGEGCFGSSGR